MSLLLPCRGRGIVLKLHDFMGFFLPAELPHLWSWHIGGEWIQDMASLIWSPGWVSGEYVGEFAGSVLPVSSACQEEKQLGIKTGSSSERLLYVIKICLWCFKNQELKNRQLFFQWDMKVKVFLSSAAIPSVRSLTFFNPFAAWNRDTNKINVWRNRSKLLFMPNPLCFFLNMFWVLRTCLLD